MYTFLKRMAPTNIEAFDATDRSTVCVRRQRTNTPLAALVLMNDPQFLEPARHLGARVLAEGGATDRERIDYLGRILRARKFDSRDHETLLAVLSQFRDEFSSDPTRANQLLKIGEKPSPSALPYGWPGPGPGSPVAGPTGRPTTSVIRPPVIRSTFVISTQPSCTHWASIMKGSVYACQVSINA